jgi:hypothetical protein
MDEASSQLGLVSIASCIQNARKIEPLHPSDSIMGEPKSGSRRKERTRDRQPKSKMPGLKVLDPEPPGERHDREGGEASSLGRHQ